MFRKMAALVLCAAVLCGLTGCGRITGLVSGVMEKVESLGEENGNISPHKYAVNTWNEVFERVQAKDTQGIYDMFSEDAKKYPDLMPEIEKLVEFMDGDVTEIGHVGASNSYSSVRDGVTVSAAYSATSDVETDSGILYWVKVGVITADEDETRLGLDWIYILDCNAKTAYSTEWGNWNERRINGAKEPEPERPEDMEVGVHYSGTTLG